MPGPIFSPTSAGVNHLLKQGATPVTEVEDILAGLGVESSRQTLAQAMPQLGDQERRVWEALGGDPRHIDDVARSSGCAAGQVAASLAMLEIKGLARHVGSMLYTRA